MTNDIKSIPAVGDTVTNVVTHKTPGDPWSITTLTFASGRSVTVSTRDATIPKYPHVDPSRFLAAEPARHLTDRGIVDEHTVTWGEWGKSNTPSPTIRMALADSAAMIMAHADGKPIPVHDRTNGRNDVVGVADNVRTDTDGNVICDVHIPHPAALQRLFDMRTALPTTESDDEPQPIIVEDKP